MSCIKLVSHPPERRDVHPAERHVKCHRASIPASMQKHRPTNPPRPYTLPACKADWDELIARLASKLFVSRRFGGAALPSGHFDGLVGSKMRSGGGEAQWRLPLEGRHYQIGDGSDIIPSMLDHVRLFVLISIRLLFLPIKSRGFSA
jgi:hypothetical protein